jgi:hypothetical protein
MAGGFRGAIDNLVEAPSGQAIQNTNVLLGAQETTGLEHRPGSLTWERYGSVRRHYLQACEAPPAGFGQHQKHHHHDAGGESAE